MIERIVKILGISEEELRKRLAYVGLTEKEKELLKELYKKIKNKELEKIFENFYKYLLSFNELRSILSHGDIKRLKKKQVEYFRQLLKCKHNMNYALQRLKVGYVHQKSGVETKYYLGAFSKWIESIYPIIKEKVDTEKIPEVLIALFKAVIFDITLELEAYYFSKILRGEYDRYRKILDSIKDAILIFELDTGKIVDLNKGACELIGESEENIIGENFWGMYEERNGDTYIRNKKTKELIPVDIKFSFFEFEKKKFFVVILIDLREKLNIEKELNSLKILYKILSGIKLAASISKDENELFDRVIEILKEGNFSWIGVIRNNEILKETGKIGEGRILKFNIDEDTYLYVLNDKFSSEEKTLLKEIAHSISYAIKQIRIKQEAEKLKTYDKKTGLLKREVFIENVKRKLNTENTGALIILDINNFKDINEVFGSRNGDKILIEVSNKLRKILDKDFILGRMGSDEFGIYIYGKNVKEKVKKLWERILEISKEPFKVGSHEIHITFSAGAVFYPENGKHFETMYTKVLISLEKAKTLKGNRLVFYSECKERKTLGLIKVKSELLKAIEKEEFTLFYQPKVELKTEKVIGVEALLRWKKGDKIILPEKFINILEDSGLIHEVGEWIIREVGNQIKKWKEKGLNISVAVNVSPLQLKLKSFISEFLENLLDCEEVCKFLEIEITETAVIEDINYFSKVLEDLKEKGVRVYIDDFGKGYSSLNILKTLPVYGLKIDKSFVKDIPYNVGNLELIKALISISKVFGLKVIAEGVETPEQAITLKELNCDYAQGYLFGKPMPPKEVENFISLRFK